MSGARPRQRTSVFSQNAKKILENRRSSTGAAIAKNAAVTSNLRIAHQLGERAKLSELAAKEKAQRNERQEVAARMQESEDIYIKRERLMGIRHVPGEKEYIAYSKNEDIPSDHKQIAAGMHSFVQTETNVFTLQSNTMKNYQSRHGDIPSRVGINAKDIKAGGDIVVSKKGKIVLCIPQTGYFKDQMLSAMGSSQENIPATQAAQSYVDHINLPCVIMFSDFSRDSIRDVPQIDIPDIASQFLSSAGWKQDTRLSRQERREILSNLQELQKYCITVRVNRGIAVDLDDDALRFVKAFTDTYKQTPSYKKMEEEYKARSAAIATNTPRRT